MQICIVSDPDDVSFPNYFNLTFAPPFPSVVVEFEFRNGVKAPVCNSGQVAMSSQMLNVHQIVIFALAKLHSSPS